MLDITLNAPRTITDWASTGGLSDFHPTAAQGVAFHFGARDWIAIVRSAGRIEVDGALKTVLGTTDTVGGNLWLLSGAGVLFTGNARVDVGGLLASTAGFSTMADALDPAKSAFAFDVAGGAGSGVTVQSGARIAGTGGTLAFIAPSVVTESGSAITGTGGTSALFAAAGTGTFAPSPLAFAGTAGGGDVTIGGTVAVDGAARFDAPGRVSVADVVADDVRVVAGDLDIETRIQAGSFSAESRGGDMTLGGADGSGAGFRLASIEFGRLKATRGASFYAGTLGAGARGNLAVGDIAYDPNDLPQLSLYADRAHSVSVTGKVAPTASGGIVQIGDALSLAEWRPSSVNVSGSFGSAIIYNEKCFDQVVSVADLRIFAVDDIVFGSAAFQTAVASTPAASIDVGRGVPATNEAGTDKLFVVAGKLTLGASGKVVQQNTAKTAGSAIGMLLANQDPGTDTVLSVDGAPRALDLFGSVLDQAGMLRSGLNAARAAELRVGGTVAVNYRFNGCALASTASCSILDGATAASKSGTMIGREPAPDDQDDTATVGN